LLYYTTYSPYFIHFFIEPQVLWNPTYQNVFHPDVLHVKIFCGEHCIGESLILRNLSGDNVKGPPRLIDLVSPRQVDIAILTIKERILSLAFTLDNGIKRRLPLFKFLD
jgi:hypothetical protein